jgi:hypothetical protein
MDGEAAFAASNTNILINTWLVSGGKKIEFLFARQDFMDSFDTQLFKEKR